MIEPAPLPLIASSAPTYRAIAPLIHSSKLTGTDRGGVGKDLSDGWCLNFAVGCTHGCRFCYVDEINKKFAGGRFKNNAAARQLVKETAWGDYFLVPEGLKEAIAATPWSRWAGKEVMLSSMHDAYLPRLTHDGGNGRGVNWARTILEAALPAGVRFCIQTRSLLVLKDLDLLSRYADQVRLQVSIATMDLDFARLIEPEVPTPQRRLEVLEKAQKHGIPTGVILAPIFPDVGIRKNWSSDFISLVQAVARVRPDHIYGESLHVRGPNLGYLEEALGEPVDVKGLPFFDKLAAIAFDDELKRQGLTGTWWPEKCSASAGVLPL